MMNGVTGVNINTQNNQMTFQAKWKKGVTKKEAYRIVDKINDSAVEFLNKDRPLEEKREIAIRKSLAELNIKCPYIGEVVERGKTTIEHIKSNFGYKSKIKAYEEYKKQIEKAVNDGIIDADQAGELLIKANPKNAKI